MPLTVIAIAIGASRRLHGRRGLKYRILTADNANSKVAAFTGGVD